MTKIRDLYEYIDSFAPFRSAMSFDNVGLLVGDGEREVTKVLVSLDITLETVAEAAALGAELIVSHHPVIFEPLRTLVPGDVPYELAKVGIAAICAHTNLDLSESFGVNTCFAAAVGIEQVRGMDVLPDLGVPQWFLGELSTELDPEEFAGLVKKTLSAGSVRYTKGRETIRKVGLLSGAGGDALAAAARAGAQAFLTGELGYHEFLLARALGVTAVDAGHFATEAVVVKPLCEKLAAQFTNVIFQISDEREPVCFL